MALSCSMPSRCSQSGSPASRLKTRPLLGKLTTVGLSSSAASLSCVQSAERASTWPVKSSSWTRWPTITMASERLSSKRVVSVLSKNSLARRRSSSEEACSGLMGSSSTMRLPPLPVTVPPTLVATITPRELFSYSAFWFWCPPGRPAERSGGTTHSPARAADRVSA